MGPAGRAVARAAGDLPKLPRLTKHERQQRVARQVYLGWPEQRPAEPIEPPPKGKRGPKAKPPEPETQYSRQGADVTRDLFRRVARLPTLRKGTGYVDEDAVRRVAADLGVESTGKLPMQAILDELDKRANESGGQRVSERTIRRILRPK
jgi:hypothetical protein